AGAIRDRRGGRLGRGVPGLGRGWLHHRARAGRRRRPRDDVTTGPGRGRCTLGRMRIEPFSIPGLGHLSAMVVDDDAGVAVVVDPRRDVDLYLERSAAEGVRIAAILETHLHNDYVSGARDLADLTGATHHIGAGAGLAYEHRGLRDGEALEVAGMRIV